MRRVDPVLFGWSYDYVGDLAETTSLIWPERRSNRAWPTLGEVVERLRVTSRAAAPDVIEEWLDPLDATGSWPLLKLITGGLRVGVSRSEEHTSVLQSLMRISISVFSWKKIQTLIR